MTDEMIPKDLPLRRKPLAQKIVLVPLSACVLAAGLSLITLAQIETVALWQPRVLSSPYFHPHLFKNSVRYLTDLQDHFYTLANFTLVPSFVLTFLFIGIYENLKRADYNRRMRDLFDKVDR